MKSNRQMEMLELILEDDILQKNYDVDISDIDSIDDALNCGKPIVECVASIIRRINDEPDMSLTTELYNSIFNNLKLNLLYED